MSGYVPNPEKAKLVADNFAFKLDAACSDFEALQCFLRGGWRIEGADQFAALQATRATPYALAQSFLFNAVRAYRIFRKGKGLMKLPSELSKRFEQTLRPVVRLRDINEHGFDVDADKTPQMHKHEDISAEIDDTAMMIVSPERIEMGSFNLFEIYQVVAAMRTVAGSASRPNDLPRPYTG